ncbi:MAG: hypothetical protein A3K12_03835 [Candidatus Rokubacteria bacterium RIFCSPLOWO2_12_FULL_71_19]|nr:MAG: hypothetical protein A3K12_03835 [Candidatus Rokubacteria bacterium RIFCSPLOWO2_12_FULL_71_19]
MRGAADLRPGPGGLGGSRLAALLLALLGLIPAGRGAGAQPAPAPAERLEAEMLRDLDVLNSGDYARDREVGKRLRLLERLRILEALRFLESPPPPAAPTGSAQPATQSSKEVR